MSCLLNEEVINNLDKNVLNLKKLVEGFNLDKFSNTPYQQKETEVYISQIKTVFFY